jgi:hypothetical protein
LNLHDVNLDAKRFRCRFRLLDNRSHTRI